LPPLRERREDIGPLADHYLAKFREKLTVSRRPDSIAVRVRRSDASVAGMRELGHAVERAVLMAGDRTISASDLGLQAQTSPARAAEEMSLEQAEKIFIQKVLARHGGDVRKAADQLGVSRSALYRRLQQFGL
jgi:DNA-binding NtrC family response regulator